MGINPNKVRPFRQQWLVRSRSPIIGIPTYPFSYCFLPYGSYFSTGAVTYRDVVRISIIVYDLPNGATHVQAFRHASGHILAQLLSYSCVATQAVELLSVLKLPDLHVVGLLLLAHNAVH